VTNPIYEIMNQFVRAHAGRNKRAPVITPDGPPEVSAPETPHPCNGCPMRDQSTDVPYCFLPVCRRDDILRGRVPTHEKND